MYFLYRTFGRYKGFNFKTAQYRHTCLHNITFFLHEYQFAFYDSPFRLQKMTS
jgi:hypothetical protein